MWSARSGYSRTIRPPLGLGLTANGVTPGLVPGLCSCRSPLSGSFPTRESGAQSLLTWALAALDDGLGLLRGQPPRGSKPQPQPAAQAGPAGRPLDVRARAANARMSPGLLAFLHLHAHREVVAEALFVARAPPPVPHGHALGRMLVVPQHRGAVGLHP